MDSVSQREKIGLLEGPLLFLPSTLTQKAARSFVPAVWGSGNVLLNGGEKLSHT